MIHKLFFGTITNERIQTISASGFNIPNDAEKLNPSKNIRNLLFKAGNPLGLFDTWEEGEYLAEQYNKIPYYNITVRLIANIPDYAKTGDLVLIRNTVIEFYSPDEYKHDPMWVGIIDSRLIPDYARFTLAVITNIDKFHNLVSVEKFKI